MSGEKKHQTQTQTETSTHTNGVFVVRLIWPLCLCFGVSYIGQQQRQQKWQRLVVCTDDRTHMHIFIPVVCSNA